MEKSNKEKLPLINVLDVTENEDGSANVTFDASDDFIELVKKDKNLDEVSQEVLSEYVQELLTKCADGKDGYAYEKTTDDN
jgi:hypothetical protein